MPCDFPDPVINLLSYHCSHQDALISVHFFVTISVNSNNIVIISLFTKDRAATLTHIRRYLVSNASILYLLAFSCCLPHRLLLIVYFIAGIATQINICIDIIFPTLNTKVSKILRYILFKF